MKLYRSRTDKKIAGVCGGIGKETGIDPTLLRLLWAMLFFFYGFGGIFYILAAIIIPKEDLREDDDHKEVMDSE